MTLAIEHTTTVSIPTLTTERFRMRAPQASDFDAYAAFCALVGRIPAQRHSPASASWLGIGSYADMAAG
jgi:hypothetical protein